MHKLKEEIKRGIKGVILGTIAFGLALGVTFCVLYGIGYVGNKLETTIGVQYENAKRERFENSTSYIPLLLSIARGILNIANFLA